MDWAIRHFHGRELFSHRGTTYNSYLISDENVVLVDTVRSRFEEPLIENVREVLDPATIDTVVASQAEADHSGGLPTVMRHAPNASVRVSKRRLENVEGHHHESWKLQAVQTADKIDIGKRHLVFVEPPMLHWPDSMFTYLADDRILMPNDAFGQHYATSTRFNDGGVKRT